MDNTPSELKQSVHQDIDRRDQANENVSFGLVTSTDGSRDAITVHDLHTGENMEKLFKMVNTGVDQVASPMHETVLRLCQGKNPLSSVVMLLDRKWVYPNVFSRPPVAFAR